MNSDLVLAITQGIERCSIIWIGGICLWLGWRLISQPYGNVQYAQSRNASSVAASVVRVVFAVGFSGFGALLLVLVYFQSISAATVETPVKATSATTEDSSKAAKDPASQ